MWVPAREIIGIDEATKQRFLAKVDFPDKDKRGCWNWNAGCYIGGYGSFQWKGQSYPAHRFGYAMLVGPIDPMMVLDHVCRNRRCVNPKHLDVVTIGENIRRGETEIKNSSKQFCLKGHEFTPENTLVRKEGWRNCRKCHNARRKTSECS